MIQRSVNQMLGFLTGAAAIGQRREAQALEAEQGATEAAERRLAEVSGKDRTELFAERDKERRTRESSIISARKAQETEKQYAAESEAETAKILQKTRGLTMPEYQKKREMINRKAQATRARNKAIKEELKKQEAKEAAYLLARGKIQTAEQAAQWLERVKRGGSANV